MNEITQKKLMSVIEVAEYLGVHKLTVYRLIKEGKFATIRTTPRSIRITHEEVERYLVSLNAKDEKKPEPSPDTKQQKPILNSPFIIRNH